MPVINLTQALIDHGLVVPEGKNKVEWCDSVVQSLRIEQRANSEIKTYFVRYRDSAGVTRHVKVGRASHITLASARSEARRLLAEIALGRDPRGEEQKRKAVPTFNEFFTDHALPYLKQHTRAGSHVRSEMLWRLRIKPGLGTKRMTEISTRDLVDLQAALAEEGLAAASVNHHHKLIRRCYSLAIQWGVVSSNPASRFKMLFEDNKVDHRMNEEQLKRFLDVLRTDDNKMVCAIARFLLATGLRTEEALSLQWRNVDLSRKTATITVSNSKSKKQRLVPLSEVAMEVLQWVPRVDGCDYVFVNRKTGKRYLGIYKVFTRLRKEAGLPSLRVHDLRANFASLALGAGVNAWTIKTLLGHANLRTTERYLSLSERTLSDATTTLAGIIKQASLPSPKSTSEAEQQQPAKDAGVEGGPVAQPEAA